LLRSVPPYSVANGRARLGQAGLAVRHGAERARLGAPRWLRPSWPSHHGVGVCPCCPAWTQPTRKRGSTPPGERSGRPRHGPGSTTSEASRRLDVQQICIGRREGGAQHLMSRRNSVPPVVRPVAAAGSPGPPGGSASNPEVDQDATDPHTGTVSHPFGCLGRHQLVRTASSCDPSNE
jgi:hypothetical protein